MNPNVWKDTITLYSYYEDPTTENITYIRTVLERNFWETQSISTRQAGGISTPEEVTLRIPWNDRYLRPDEFTRLDKLELADHWTVAIGVDLMATRILHFDCPFEFGWGQGNDFIRNYVHLFTREFEGQIHLAQDENPHLFGSRNRWNIVVTC